MKKVVAFVTKNPSLILFSVVLVVVIPQITKILGLFTASSKTEVDEKLDASKSSLTDVEALQIAQGLHIAMRGSGTDENSIYNLLKDLSKYEFYHVYNKFGKRQYSNTFGNIGDPLTSEKQDLLYWLSSELNSNEKKKLVSLNANLSFLR